MIRVAVVGAYGRMGSQVCRAVDAADDLELVAHIGRGDSIELATASDADVAVDFTTPDSVMDNLRTCIRLGIHTVVGTSGFDDKRLTQLHDWLGAAPSVGVLIGSSFSLGSALMARFAVQAAPFFESVELVELHHPDKVDAPSGFARRTMEMIAQARAEAGTGPVPDATTQEIAGARGADIDGIHVHSVRLRGLLGHHELLLGGMGETLTIRQDSFDRESFMAGVLTGVRAIREHPGLTIGLHHFLGVD